MDRKGDTEEGQFHIQVAKLVCELVRLTPESLLLPQAHTAFSCYLPVWPGSTEVAGFRYLDPTEPLQELRVLPVIMPHTYRNYLLALSPVICLLQTSGGSQVWSRISVLFQIV